MGYKCDVCTSEDAAVFCFADQAVMCRACDSRVHSANKLAKKHERVSLQRESESATCDICQEHKAIMFCSEDRALICRRCDLMIHTANEFVSKHHRYLLSGVAVGLKALEGYDNDEVEEGKNRKPYSLRNTGAGPSKDKEIAQAPIEQNTSWRTLPTDHPANGLAGTDRFGSQPSLINVQNVGNMSNNPALGSLQGTSTSYATPFGRQDEQYTSASPSESPPTGGVPDPFSGWGADMLGGGSDPNSNDFTLAAELLGMPSVSQAFTAKDIDAAYIFDDDKDLDTNLSALLEVPDLEAFQTDNPHVVNQGALKPGSVMDLGPRKRGSPSDGVVPDLHQDDSRKRQRL